MDKITIIVPIYNVEKYLREALDSVVNQTYKNIEVLLIDDGSTDNSSKIAEEYTKKDNRFILIHQENKGLSGARNTGLENATGKYIMFLDSDDFFEPTSCEDLYNCIEKTGADYAIGNYTNTNEDGKKWSKPVFDKEKYSAFKLSIKDYTHSFYIMNSGVWNKIFRKTFLDKLKIRFVEKLPAEDAIFTTYCFIHSEKVFYTPENVYNYRLRDSNSISTNCSKSYFLGINKAYRIIYDNFRTSNNLEYYRYYYAKSMNYILYRFIDTDLLTNEERVEVLEKMKWFYMLNVDLKIPTIIKSVQYIIESIVNKDYEQTLKYCDILKQVRRIMSKEEREKMSKPSPSTYKEIESKDMDPEIVNMKEKLLKEMQNSKIKILNIEDSINKKLLERKSIARFGDGELDLILGKDLDFQPYNEELANKLEKILRSKQDFCLIGIPDVINEFNNLTEESEVFWIRNMDRTRSTWLKYLNEDMEYATANLTRLYIRYKDRSNTGKYFSMLKQIWKDRDIIICEGEQTRIGVGNDLLDKCKSVRRIICPSEDAFSKYNEILERVKEEPKDTLIILALGPTATVLAYDLAKEGYQALDMGHFDIEYEWYKRNAKKREKIANKYTNEVSGGNITINVQDKKYLSQIIEDLK